MIYGEDDAADRLRQFEVVCRTALKLAGLGSQRRLTRTSGGIAAIGKAEFGLTHHQIKYCLGRARNFIAEARELERSRNKAMFKQSPSEWSYL